MDVSAVGNGLEEVEESTNWHVLKNCGSETEGNGLLSLAVLAFAVEDMNDRDLLITSATPCAFLGGMSIVDCECIVLFDILLITVQLSELDQSCLLVA